MMDDKAVFVDTWGWMALTDLTSMVIMDERGIAQVLTADEHFIQVGMGFCRVP